MSGQQKGGGIPFLRTVPDTHLLVLQAELHTLFGQMVTCDHARINDEPGPCMCIRAENTLKSMSKGLAAAFLQVLDERTEAWAWGWETGYEEASGRPAVIPADRNPYRHTQETKDD